MKQKMGEKEKNPFNQGCSKTEKRTGLASPMSRDDTHGGTGRRKVAPTICSRDDALGTLRHAPVAFASYMRINANNIITMTGTETRTRLSFSGIASLFPFYIYMYTYFILYYLCADF